MDPLLVARGRQEEVDYVRRRKVYVRVPREQCYADTGKEQIKTGWVETNKGTAHAPDVRCRWVAKDFRKEPRPDLYAPTPPLEALKLILSHTASTAESDQVIAIIDVRRAYFYAPTHRNVYVELPVADWQPGDEQMCGLLLASL